jgi:hypothetical protein
MSDAQRSYWIGVVSAEHVKRGVAGGFSQVCHGKSQPLKRLQPGDGFVYYSPNLTFQGKERYQTFTAIGTVKDGPVYPFDMGNGFVPYRRDIAWADGVAAPIQPLLDQLDFTAGRRNWGYQLRFGLFPISEHDFRLIAAAMRAELGALLVGC